MKDLKFIPDPQNIERKDGRLTIPDDIWQIYIGEIDLAALLINSKEIFGDYRIVGCSEDADIVLQIRQDLSFPDDMRDDVRNQSYQLDINSSKIELSASTAPGIFYGLQTLRQIINQTTSEIPAMRILDWPDMPFRGVHLTLGSGHMPTFEKLKELIVHFSQCKINRFVLEYDDRFPWEKHPIIVHPDALTKNQIRELIDHAEKHYIDIIPLLDSLGHAQAYLAHDEYQHLAEIPGDTAEMCPSNPETLIFIKELWNEILEVHKDCDFAHISGDEVFRLGAFCPRCQLFADEKRLSDLYCEYYKNLSEWILERGRRPIMWADMILKFPERIETLPREVVFNDWEYRGSGPEWTVTRMLNVSGLTLDKGTLNMVPPEHREYFDKYYLKDDKATFKPFPGVRILKDHGFEVLGSSSTSTESGMNLTSPPFSVSLNNNRYYAKAIVKANAMGLLNTFWSSNHSIEASMHGIWAGAAYSWKFKEEDNSFFLNKCEQVFMRLNSGLFSKFACDIDRYNVPESGVFTPVAEKDCPTVDSFRLPVASDCVDPITREYLANLQVSAQEIVEIEKSLSSKTEIMSHDFGDGSYVCIDLRQYMNANHASVIHLSGRNFIPMGTGRKICRGVEFNIVDPKSNGNHSAIGLRGPYMPHWPEIVKIEVNDTFEQLFFINSCAYAPSGEVPAICEIKYADGSIEEYDFEVGKNVGDWNRANFNLPYGFPAFTWYTYDDAGTLRSSYISRWINPFPEKDISHLQLSSGSGDGDAFFFAITGWNCAQNLKM